MLILQEAPIENLKISRNAVGLESPKKMKHHHYCTANYARMKLV